MKDRCAHSHISHAYSDRIIRSDRQRDRVLPRAELAVCGSVHNAQNNRGYTERAPIGALPDQQFGINRVANAATRSPAPSPIPSASHRRATPAHHVAATRTQRQANATPGR